MIHKWTWKLECIRFGVGWGGYMHTVYQYQCVGSGGGVCDYDLNIESNINLAGDAIIKIYIIDY